MKIGIVGAGAVGSYVGGLLAASGADVSLVARGSHLQAIREQGLRLVDRKAESQQIVQPRRATEDIAALSDTDWVLVTLKAHSLRPIAPQLSQLQQAGIPLVLIQNGIPWWYFYGLSGEWANHQLQSVDPEGGIAAHLDPAQIIGGVVYVAAALTQPGEVTYGGLGRLILGSIGIPQSEARLESLDQLVEALKLAQLNPNLSSAIRMDIWVKLWGNAALNPLSVLTGVEQDRLCHFPPTRELIRQMMQETRAVALQLGVELPSDIEARLDAAGQVKGHRTSMLQDFEQGRPLEVEGILGSVIELGQLVGIPTPHLDSIYAPVKFVDPGRS